MNGITLTVLQIIQHGVVTKFVTPVHKFFQQESCLLLPADTALLAETLTFLIEIMQFEADDLLIFLTIIVDKCLPHGFLFGDTRFETMFGKMHEQGLKVIPAFPVLHFLKRTVQCSFINLLESTRRLISRLQARQKIFLSLLALPESLFTHHGERLFQAERHRVRVIIRSLIQCHPASLRQYRFFQVDVKRE